MRSVVQPVGGCWALSGCGGQWVAGRRPAAPGRRASSKQAPLVSLVSLDLMCEPSEAMRCVSCRTQKLGCVILKANKQIKSKSKAGAIDPLHCYWGERRLSASHWGLVGATTTRRVSLSGFTKGETCLYIYMKLDLRAERSAGVWRTRASGKAQSLSKVQQALRQLRMNVLLQQKGEKDSNTMERSFQSPILVAPRLCELLGMQVFWLIIY